MPNVIKNTVKQVIQEFSSNQLFDDIENGTFTLEQYQQLLVRLYHQVKNSSVSFAIAGGALAARDKLASEYLIAHAEEEMTHYHWIEDDLKNTGYKGEIPSSTDIPVEVSCYIAFNFYCAHHFPYSRLAIAAVLEGISGTYGTSYGLKMAKQLDLTKEQAVFFLAHGELDKDHVDEVFETLDKSDITPTDVEHCVYAAKTAGVLYKALYRSV